MNTKLLMTVAALVLGMIGILLSFLPKEMLMMLGMPADTVQTLLIQLMGALYFSFAMLNWMSKENIFGGIYGRPIVVSNMTHFLIGAITLMKGAIGIQQNMMWLAAAVYGLFAILFSLLLYTHPSAGTPPVKQ